MSFDLQIPLLKLGPHGGTRVMVEFANFVAAQGFRVRVLIPRGRQEKHYEFHPKVELKEIVCVRVKGLDYLTFLAISPLYMRQGVLAANFFPTFYPVFLASLCFQRPYIYLVQGIETYFRGSVGRVLNVACRLTWGSQRMIATSPYVASVLRAKHHHLLKQVQVGAAEIFLTAPVKSSIKNYDLICFPRGEAFKRADRIKLVIDAYRTTYGPLRVLCVGQDETLLTTCKSWGCDVLAPQSDVELIDAIDQSRIVLFTSDHEGLGLPPLECMARGLPAIVFENDGAKAYMRNGENGFIISGGEYLKAASAIHQASNDYDLYCRMSVRAASDARAFSMTKAFIDVLPFLPSPKG